MADNATARIDATAVDFEENAVASFVRSRPVTEVLEIVGTPAWTVVMALSSFALAALLLGFFGHVDITTRAPGALRSEGDVLTLHAQVAGQVQRVLVRSGDKVQPGQPLIEISSPEIDALALEARERFNFEESHVRESQQRLSALYAARLEHLDQNLRLLVASMASQQKTIARDEQKAQSAQRLWELDAISKLRLESFLDELETSKRSALELEIAHHQAQTRKNALKAQQEAEQLRLTQERDEARSALDAALLMRSQLKIPAPTHGFIEAMIIREGEFIAQGMSVGSIVPGLRPTRVIAFITERDRAFLQTGASARIELDQLPHTEFGALQGKVVRVATSLASIEELRKVLGDNVELPPASYRVEIAISPSSAELPISKYLKSGMLSQVRFTLRSRRLISLVLQPLQRLLD